LRQFGKGHPDHDRTDDHHSTARRDATLDASTGNVVPDESTGGIVLDDDHHDRTNPALGTVQHREFTEDREYFPTLSFDDRHDYSSITLAT
jgi:hypothetical protein